MEEEQEYILELKDRKQLRKHKTQKLDNQSLDHLISLHEVRHHRISA